MGHLHSFTELRASVHPHNGHPLVHYTVGDIYTHNGHTVSLSIHTLHSDIYSMLGVHYCRIERGLREMRD